MASQSHGTTLPGMASPGSEDHGKGDAHESFIKTPRQLIAVVVLALVGPIVLLLLLAHFVSSGSRTGAGADAMSPERIVERIRPVARLELRDASVPQEPRAGAEVYKAVCSACHETGAAGAPKHKDAGAWSARIATGLEALVQSALKGKGAMPAQGGGDYSELEIARAVVYMANDAGGKFDEPQP